MSSMLHGLFWFIGALARENADGVPSTGMLLNRSIEFCRGSHR